VPGGAEEVGNPMGVGAGRESGSQVRPDRDPEVRRSRAPGRLRAERRAGGASTRGEGESPTAEREDPGGEEGQESIGPDTGLTAGVRERTLGWSKALKPPAPARSRWLREGQTNPVAPFGRFAHQPRGRPAASPSPNLASAGGRREDAEGSPGAHGANGGRGRRGRPETEPAGAGVKVETRSLATAGASRNGRRAEDAERRHG
jgi:hypothetical protein